MKIDLLLRKRRGRREAPRLSLFPFLAVLICTMGALAVLFLAVTRQARLQAQREAASRIVARQTTLKADQELVQWRIEQLKKSRTETETQLVDARLQLGHVEEHAQRLAQRLDELRGEAKKLEERGLTIVQRRRATQEELTRLEGQLGEAQARLEGARQQASKRPRSYAIIPYEGPNETHRRPIYIECRVDAIYLQPEGVRFGVEDFEGPPGAGNPLAAALRATREYLLSQGGFDVQRDGEPYPLLLVRPNGVVAYYAARAAMQSWASEYGYELIGDDWQLQYPQPDARLAQAASRAADMARARQRELIAAAPRSYGARSKPVYRAGASGGLVRDDGHDDDDERGGYRSRRPAGRYGRSEGFGDGSEREGFGSGGSGSSGGGTSGTGTASGPRGGNGSWGGTGSGSGRGTGTGITDGNEHPVLPYANIKVGGPPGGPGGTMANGTGIAGGAPNGTGIASGMPNGAGAWGGTGSASGAGAGGGMPNSTGMVGGTPNGNVAWGGTGSGSPNSTGIANGTPNSTGSASGSGIGGEMSGGTGMTGGMPGGSGATMGNGTGIASGTPNSTGIASGTPNGTGMSGGTPNGTGIASGTPNSTGIASGTPNGTGIASGTPNGTGMSGGTPGGTGSAGGAQGGTGSASGALASGAASNGQAAGAAGASPGSMEGYVAGRPTETQPMTRRPVSTEGNVVASVPAEPPRPGEFHPREEFAPPPKRDEEPVDKRKRKDLTSVAEKRGIDWGIRNAARGSVAITRQIRVECYADRLVLPGGKVIPVDGGADRAIDRFMSAVWEHMDSWGLAGQRMYWRPILNFYVIPGGEPRFEEMRSLLAGSGLSVERKQ